MQNGKITHLDLFSGIGGFALASEKVWSEVEHIFCEIDPFCQAVLKKHWPNSPIYGDIKELTSDTLYTRLERSKQAQGTRHARLRDRDGENKASRIDLLTGGFPCQPFSAAGRRRGTEDDRHLWPEMLRVIRETNPTWVIGENVRGLLTWDGGVVLDQVFSDLEGLNYEVGAFVIPAVAVNAPHRRDRVWIVAHAIGSDAGRTSRAIQSTEDQERLSERNDMAVSCESDQTRHAQDPERKRTRRRMEDSGQVLERESTKTENARPDWSVDWPEVATRLCTLDDGLPNGLVRPRGWRNAALKAAGNAIVPQVAEQIMLAIRDNKKAPA